MLLHWENSTFTLSQGVRDIKRLQPKLYDILFKKIYKDVDMFNDWRLPCYYAACTLYGAIQDRVRGNARLDWTPNSVQKRDGLLVATSWALAGTPMFFVSPELYKAVSKTEPPDTSLDDLKMPFDAMMFILPKGSLFMGDQEVTHFGFTRVLQGQSTAFEQGKILIENKEPHQIFAVCTGLPDGKYLAVSTPEPAMRCLLRGEYQKVLDRGAEVEIAQGGCDPRLDPEGIESASLYIKLNQLALNFILAIEARPDLLERGRKLHQHKKDAQREIWQPNILGRRYRIQYTGGVDPGTHSSPRMHWRRGHFRQQGIGHRNNNCVCGHTMASHYRVKIQAFDPELPREHCEQSNCSCEYYTAPDRPYESYKRIWIEPCLVSGAPDKIKIN